VERIKPAQSDIEAHVCRSREGPCFVCQVVAGTTDAPPHVVYRDNFAIGFLNLYPTLLGYCLVAPIAHRTAVVDDFTDEEYLRLQAVVRRVGRAISQAVPTERLYILSLGSNSGNAHVHWHLAPLPPGVPYQDQQLRALMARTNGFLQMSTRELDETAARIRSNLP
jgi:diadenosine tetraphosphate (Ap4A) HIT family hydrolase